MSMQQVVEYLSLDGYEVNEVIPDGKIHRFDLNDNDYKESGWYVCFCNQKNDAPYYHIVYGDWKTNQTKHQSTLHKSDLTRGEEKSQKAQVKAAIAQANKDRAEGYAREALEAQKFWDKLPDKGQSEYLKRKGLEDCFLFSEEDLGVRFESNTIIVPIRDIDGKIQSIERIFPDGKKLFWKGAKKQGGCHVIGKIKDKIYFSEGFATSASIHLATNQACVDCFGLNSIEQVVDLYRGKFPEKELIICGDKNTSEGSQSERIATEAAKLHSVAIVFPSFSSIDSSLPPPTDFNDLHTREGLEALRKILCQNTSLVVIPKMDEGMVIEKNFPHEDNGRRLATIENLNELMRRTNIIVRYNVISKKNEYLPPPPFASTLDNEGNTSLAVIMSWCERCQIPTKNLMTYLTALADQNQYNPVKAWIESEPWDGVCRLQAFYETVKSPDMKLKNTLMRYWLISAIAAAYEPSGVKADGILVFQGIQFGGKTEWFKKLAPKKLISEGVTLKLDQKDSIASAISFWINELGELDATFRRSDIAQLKAFTSKTTDIFRRPFALADSYYPRRTVFVASVNDMNYLNDPTGNRRFWTIPCEGIDIAHEVNMQQLWAQVYEQLYLAGERWYMSQEENKELAIHNEDFEALDAIAEKIQTKFDWNDPRRQDLTLTEVSERIGLQNPNTKDLRSVANAVRRLTGMQKPKKTDGRRVYPIAPFIVMPQVELFSNKTHQ